MSGQTEQEPSIEEILASIRQIISDDDDVAPEAPAEPEKSVAPENPKKSKPEPKKEPEAQPEPEGDVLELKDPLPAPMTPPVIDMEDALEEDDEKEFLSSLNEDDESHDIVVAKEESDIIVDTPPKSEPESEPEPEEALVTEPHIPVAAPDQDSILSEAARSAALSGFSKLANTMPLERGTTSQNAAGGLTLEDILRDMLNPLLREWLDANLPDIIENLVQKELDKLARRASDD